MGTAFAQMFAVFSMFFAALHELMSALFNMAKWTNQASGQFADVSAWEREQARKKMLIDAGITEEELQSAIKKPNAPAAPTARKLSAPVEATPKADPAQSDLQLPSE